MDKVVDNEKSNKIRHRLGIALDISLVVLGVAALAVSGVLIYQKVYLTPFWVNGQSMYPLLNEKATRKDGTLKGRYGGASDDGDTMVDYGVMDTHEKAKKNLKRFDVVVTKYKENDTSKKIKRVVGLPGETIKFTSIGVGDATNGDLYVKEGDKFVLVEQPIANEYKVAGTNYPVNEIKLGDDEYYVLGDNRDNSRDSRDSSVGPIKYNYIVGKVVAICGYGEVKKDSNGHFDVYNIDYHWPRYL